jgi:hypothetical protein
LLPKESESLCPSNVVPKKKIERKKEFDLSVTSLMIERMQVQS